MVADFKNNKQKQENQVIVEKFLGDYVTLEHKIVIYLSIASVGLLILYYIVTYIISFINSFKK